MRLEWWWRAKGYARPLKPVDFAIGAAALVIAAPLASLFLSYLLGIFLGRGWPPGIHGGAGLGMEAIQNVLLIVVLSPLVSFLTLPIGFALFIMSWRAGATGFIPAMLVGAATGPMTALILNGFYLPPDGPVVLVLIAAIPGALLGLIFWCVTASRAILLPPPK